MVKTFILRVSRTDFSSLSSIQKKIILQKGALAYYQFHDSIPTRKARGLAVPFIIVLVVSIDFIVCTFF